MFNNKSVFMKKKFTLASLILAMGMGTIFAQNTQVTGHIVDENGEPVIGATIIVKGTSIGTVTDFDGNFSLEVPANGKQLEVSYVGMEKQIVAVAPNVNVELKSDSQALDEVVVTGYGSFKKSSFTGSASSITTEGLKDIPALNVQDKLAGAVAGVQISSTSGQPGAVASVRIRGMGSINAGNEPLYVIDGVPMQSSNMNGFEYDDAGNSPLSTINSNDIESMTVIKDAAAASLYGSRAANGVIVITTKRGKAGKTSVNAKADWGFSDMAINYRPTLSGEDRRDILHLGLKNYALNDGMSEAEAIAFADSEIDGFAAKPWSGYTDWRDVLLRKGSHQNYEVNAQGGNEKTKFYASLSYTDQEGISLNSDYKRYTGRASVTHEFGRVKLEASTMFSSTNQHVSNESTSFASPIMCMSMTASPSTYPYNEDGTYSTNFPALNGANPLQTAHLNYNLNKVNRTLNNISADWNIWDNLHLKEVINYDFYNNNASTWWHPESNDGRSSQGVMQRYMMNFSTLNTQTQLFYNKTFGNHTIDALLGFETEDYLLDYTYSNGNTYPTNELPEITNAADTRAASAYEGYRMVSYLGRVNYDYADRYYASVSFRRDGSSRLARESRWGNFWSASASWRLSQESFMESVHDLITDAKIRASYGVNGTQPEDYYTYMGIYQFGYNYNGQPGSAEYRIDNPNLKWEKNYATNIGFDITFLNRFSMTFDWYNRDTKDLLMEKPISQITGFKNMMLNVGSMRNRGFELELKSQNIVNDDFTWVTTLNVAHNKNTLTKLDGLQSEVIDGIAIHRVGSPYHSFYAYEYAGVDPETGKESFYVNGENGDRSITTNYAEANKILVGSVEPKIQGGLTNSMSYKFIDFSFTLTYSLGGNVFDNAKWLQSNGGTYNYLGQVPSYYDIDKTWKQPGDNAELPQFAYGNTNVVSSRWMMSTNHLRLKNMTLGFTVPSNLLAPLGINRLRAYMSGNNLLTWKSKDLYVDPETRPDGLATFETPTLRTLTFGVEIGF